MHAKPVATVDQGRASLGFLDKWPKNEGLDVVQPLHASLRDNATVVGLIKALSVGVSECDHPRTYGHY